MRSIMFALLLACSAAAAHAAPRSDVRAVADMVTDRSIPVLQRTSYGEEGTEIVFIEGGVRYTIYNSGHEIVPGQPNTAWLSIWTRPDGTYGRASMLTFSDSGFDGSVDFGVTGTGTDQAFDSGAGLSSAHGAQYRQQWQDRYDAAIAAAMRYRARYRR